MHSEEFFCQYCESYWAEPTEDELAARISKYAPQWLACPDCWGATSRGTVGGQEWEGEDYCAEC